MNSTKKLMLAAGILSQLSAGLYADAWSDAFDVFDGPAAVANNHMRMSWAEAQRKAQQNGNTPELLAVAVYEAQGNQQVNLRKAGPRAASMNDLQVALADALNPVVAVNPSRAVNEPAAAVKAAAPVSSGWGSLWGSSAQPAISSADVQRAIAAQQKQDAAIAATNSKALSQIVNSNATGASLYNAYVDLILSGLQQAVNAIVDPAVQLQVIQYAQNKLTSMKASVSAMNRMNARELGRMNSGKKAKGKRARA